jgi:anaerobic selenocysteine-containing dehydrogenase
MVARDDRALDGTYRVATVDGEIECRPAFALYADLCRRYPPERVEKIAWVPAAQIRQAARLLWESRPVSYYCWTGVGQTTNATQTDRAIALLYALTGSYDAPGGSVIFPRVPTNDVSGTELMSDAQRATALGLAGVPSARHARAGSRRTIFIAPSSTAIRTACAPSSASAPTSPCFAPIRSARAKRCRRSSDTLASR